jgi:hypothetical protein
MTFAQLLAPVGQGDVEPDDEMTVTREVQRTVRSLPPFDDPGEGKRLELSFGVPLLDARPHRGALRGLLAERERMEEPEPPGICESLEGLRGALVLFIAPALQQGWVARKKVELEVFDGHPLTARLVYDKRVVGFFPYILRLCRMWSSGSFRGRPRISSAR